MSTHTISVKPTRNVPAHMRDYSTLFYRWTCSCGQRGKSVHCFEGQAEQAGLEHAKAKG